MLFRLVRSVKRSGSNNLQFEKRIPTDVLPQVAGLKLSIPIGDGEFRHVTISPAARAVRFSLGTFDPSLAKSRTGRAAAYLEDVWRSLRQKAPASLTHRQATALAGELYRAWTAEVPREGTLAILRDPSSPTGWVRVDENDEPLHEEEAEGFAILAAKLDAKPEVPELEAMLGGIVDRLLLSRGIAAVDGRSRVMLLQAFALALRDGFALRARQAAGDYSPDPNSERFPEWVAPGAVKPSVAPPKAPVISLKGLVEDWWIEAEKTGLKPSTYVNYRNVILKLAAFLEHDDAGRVSPEDVLRYKDHRLASVYPKSGKPISPKTVKDTDLAALKTVFGWAVTNRKVASNPAAGITVKVRKGIRLRGKSQTSAEAAALLAGALAYRAEGKESAFTSAAKRWVPWLCAYSLSHS